LALTLLLAATKTLEWERGINIMAPTDRRPDYEPDDGPLTDEQLDQLRAMARDDLPTGQIITKQSLFDPEATEFFDRAREKARALDAGTYEPPEEESAKKKSILSGLDNMWARAKKIVTRDSEAEHAPLEQPKVVEESLSAEDLREREAERAWKAENPNNTLKKQRQLFRNGLIPQLPWMESEFQNRVLASTQLQADNDPQGTAGEVRGFGTAFPPQAVKGDMFLRVDRLPTALYKYNGSTWIEVDKSLSDTYSYDHAYIDHLIEKISSGEYDPELLSDAERDSIEKRLSSSSNFWTTVN
jgi:hypothetical protein